MSRREAGRGVNHVFNVRQFIFGFFLFFIGLLICAASTSVGGIIALMGVVLMIIAFLNKMWFCCDCGNYLGDGFTSPPSTCHRCGCNIYTEEFQGVGVTFRDGGRNWQ
jgi:hypothetical protein